MPGNTGLGRTYKKQKRKILPGNARTLETGLPKHAKKNFKNLKIVLQKK